MDDSVGDCCEICGNDEDTREVDGLVWCPICLALVRPGVGEDGINHVGPGAEVGHDDD